MDLSEVSAAAEKGATLELKDPSGHPIFKADGKTPVTITLAGTESEKWKKARSVIGNKYLKTAGPNRPPGAKTVEEYIGDDSSQLAAVTLAWDGIVFDGQEQECNHANAMRLYSRFEWIRAQVNEFVGERANFWKASS